MSEVNYFSPVVAVIVIPKYLVLLLMIRSAINVFGALDSEVRISLGYFVALDSMVRGVKNYLVYLTLRSEVS